jgi:hypothetical protein
MNVKCIDEIYLVLIRLKRKRSWQLASGTDLLRICFFVAVHRIRINNSSGQSSQVCSMIEIETHQNTPQSSESHLNKTVSYHLWCWKVCEVQSNRTVSEYRFKNCESFDKRTQWKWEHKQKISFCCWIKIRHLIQKTQNYSWFLKILEFLC